MKNTMEELEVKALACLREIHPRTINCGTLGDRIFAEHIKEKGHHNGSAPFARITGKIMARLQKKGFAYVTTRGSRCGWVISQEGLAHGQNT